VAGRIKATPARQIPTSQRLQEVRVMQQDVIDEVVLE